MTDGRAARPARRARKPAAALAALAALLLAGLLAACAPAQDNDFWAGGTDERFWRLDWADRGETLYMVHCAACHWPQGEGAEDIYPPLANNALVSGPFVDPLMPIMFGRGAMPGFKGDLTDEEIALILSYIRTRWGNSGQMVSPERVGIFRSDDAEVTLNVYGTMDPQHPDEEGPDEE